MTEKRRGKKLALLAGVVVVVLLVVGFWATHDQLRFWWLLESIGVSEQGYAEYRHRQTGIVFVAIPAGQHSVGSSAAERERVIQAISTLDQPARAAGRERVGWEFDRTPVTVTSFLIAKYEVSENEWAASWAMRMGRNTRRDEPPARSGNWPASRTWLECKRWCDRHGIRLPSELQWEYACRAKTDSAFAFGERLPKDAATFCEEEDRYSKAMRGSMGSFEGNSAYSGEPNRYGLHNMHGNVAEWCRDPWNPSPDRVDPASGERGKRVFRGGGWVSPEIWCRSAARGGAWETLPLVAMGFRPVFDPP